MADQVYFEDVAVGDLIPSLSVTVDETQMFFFSAATYNGHRIHYDRTWATETEGYPDILVHGPLQAALLARAVTDWAGPRGRLVSFAIQNRASAHPGEELRFTGTVTSVRSEESVVDLELRGSKNSGGEDQLLMPGSASVRLPRREA